jgi:hypothetical protein
MARLTDAQRETWRDQAQAELKRGDLVCYERQEDYLIVVIFGWESPARPKIWRRCRVHDLLGGRNKWLYFIGPWTKMGHMAIEPGWDDDA